MNSSVEFSLQPEI